MRTIVYFIVFCSLVTFGGVESTQVHDYQILDTKTIRNAEYIKLRKLIVDFNLSSGLNLIENRLDISRFVKRVDNKNQVDIDIYNCDGLTSNAAPLFSSAINKSFSVSFYYGSFEFYSSNVNRISKIESCDQLLLDYFNGSANLTDRDQLLKDFKGTFSLQIRGVYVQDTVRFDSMICPLVFKDSDLNMFYLTYQINTSFARNLIKFERFHTNKSLNSQIRGCSLDYAYNLFIDFSQLEQNLFQHLKQLGFKGVFIGFREDLFRSIQNLSYLLFGMRNTRQFFHSSTNKWISYLNNRIEPYEKLSKLSTSDLELYVDKHKLDWVITFDDYIYDFPDEDFCLFRHLSYKQLVFPHPVYGKKYLSTCLQKFLFSYQHKIKENLDMTEEFYNKSFEQECNFTGRLQMCEGFKNKPIDIDFNYFTLIYILKWIMFILSIILMPIVAAIGFSLNLLIILIILNKENQKQFFQHQRMFTYMLFNSLFNMIECFLSMFKLMSYCLGTNSPFCSTVMKNLVAQYFKLYFVIYFGEVMKTSSILTSLAFSFERLIVTSGSKMCICNKFQRMNLIVFMVIVLIFSFGISYNKLLEYKIIESKYDDDDDETENIVEAPKPAGPDISYEKFWPSYSLVHYILNNLVFILLNLIIDLLLVLQMRKQLKVKAINAKAFHKSSSRKNSLILSNKLNEILKAETELNKMILYMFLIYLICRLPELFSFLVLKERLLFKVTSYIYTARYIYSLQTNIVHFFYLVSYLFNIFFYYKFNKFFRQAFKLTFANFCIKVSK